MPNIRDTKHAGFQRGWNIASWQNLPEIGDTIPSSVDWVGYRVVDADNLCDVWEMYCFEAESNDRDFSPFEFTAHELNESRNSEALWEAFDAGISDGIRSYWRKNYAKKKE